MTVLSDLQQNLSGSKVALKQTLNLREADTTTKEVLYPHLYFP